MTLHEFINVDKTVKTRTKMGNGQIIQAKGKCTLVVKTENGTRYIKK